MKLLQLRHLRRFLPALLVTLLLITLSDGAALAGISDSVKTETLANGLHVLVLENHKAPVATFNVFYRVGSRNEQTGKTGLSHLLEHLMFRGTKKLKPEEFSNIIQENGGMDNAFTEQDLTDYFEVINRDHLDVPISLEGDRMANFAPQGFDSERAVVMEERRMRTEDNPEDALGEMTQAQAYVEHPYHWPVIGWMHDVRRLTLADAMKYHQVYYSPQNALIVAVGDFDANKVLKQISESFGSIKNEAAKPASPDEVEPPQKGERHVVLEHAANLPAFAQAYHVPNYKSADAFPLEVLSDLLAGGKSSRLYKKMVIEKRMVVGIDASYDLTSFDPGLFWVSAQMRPGIKAEDAMAEVDKELRAEAVDAPVNGLGEHDVFAGSEQTKNRVNGRHAGSEHVGGQPAFQFRDRPFESLAIGMIGARVVVAAPGLPQFLVNVGRSLVDGRNHRTGRRIRFLTHVNRIGCKSHSLLSFSVRPCDSAGRRGSRCQVAFNRKSAQAEGTLPDEASEVRVMGIPPLARKLLTYEEVTGGGAASQI
jgi:zinc protease